MESIKRRATCGILIACGAIASTALAATPESGTVSEASPKVTWTSELTGSWFPSRAVIAEQAAGQNGMTPCEAPTCDTFTLTVADQRDLSIGLNGPEADDQLIYRITKPDGEYVSGTENAGANGYLVVKIKNAPTGSYLIELWNYYTASATHENYAELAVAKPAPVAPPAGGTPPPSGNAPQPTTVEAISVDVKVGKASAKKLARSRKLAATVTVSRPVTSVKAVLKKGSKTVGKGSLGATSGSKKLTLKLSKKFKKGTYSLTVVASDGKTSGTKTIKVKVGK